jgi:hypothetical protein
MRRETEERLKVASVEKKVVRQGRSERREIRERKKLNRKKEKIMGRF